MWSVSGLRTAKVGLSTSGTNNTVLAQCKRCEPLVGSDGKIGQSHVATRIDMVLYGCLKLLGSPGNLVEGTGNPHYIQKSLTWTKLDTAMARLEG